MATEFDNIDFKLVFNKLLEINERSVEQLIRFKEMLNKNSDQFDHIIKKIDVISDKFKVFETTLEILKSKRPIDALNKIDNRILDDFKSFHLFFNELKSIMNEIYEMQSEFRENAKDEIREINSILSTVHKNQESFQSKGGVISDDIKEIRRILDDFNKRVSFESKLNKVIGVATAAFMMISAFFAFIK